MSSLSDYFPTLLDDATASQWHIVNGKTAYIPAGKVIGNGYFPGMMKFDGSTGYYSNTGLTFSGNKVTGVAQFKLPSSAVDQRIFTVYADVKNRFALTLKENDHANADVRGKLQLFSMNTAGTVVCRVQSSTAFNDDVWHTAFVEYDGDAGTAVMRVDGNDQVDAANSLHILTTGTLPTTSLFFYVGSSHSPDFFSNGLIGFAGYRDIGGLNWSNFMHPDGTPKPLDETTWSQWGGVQPLFWHEAGKMDENKGSAGAMTKNGTITLASALA